MAKTFKRIMDNATEGAVFFGDWHGDMSFAIAALERAIDKYPDINVFYHVGDFGLWPGGQSYIKTVADIMESSDKTLVVTGGNHEDWNQWDRLTGGQTRPYVYEGNGLALLPKVQWWTHAGLRFLSVGGASSIDRAWRKRNVSWWPQEGIQEDAVERVIKDDSTVDILITHEASDDPVPPVRQVLDNPFVQARWPLEDIQESEVQRDRVSQIVKASDPQVHLHGHWHIPYVREQEYLRTVSLGANFASYAENAYAIQDFDTLH